MSAVDILIPNRFSWNGVALAVESILKRTEGGGYRIIVADNSASSPTDPRLTDDGNRRDYLRALAAAGLITLIETGPFPDGRYGHGENLRVLLAASTADYAVLFNNSAEVKRPDWITMLTRLLRTRDDLGVARERPAVNHFDVAWRAPCYWANIALIDMVLYRTIMEPTDWRLDYMAGPAYPHPEQFAALAPPVRPEHTPPDVLGDTGWRLWERLHYRNPANYGMVPLPGNYLDDAVSWIGGLDRTAKIYHDWLLEIDDSHPTEVAHVQRALDLIDVRLEIVREGNEQI